MKSFVRIMVETHDSVDAFKATELWSIIDEIHGPTALDVEVIHGAGNKIAVITSNADAVVAGEANDLIESTIRPKVIERIGRPGHIRDRLSFDTEDALNAWKASF
jgi:hypothetical protein